MKLKSFSKIFLSLIFILSTLQGFSTQQDPKVIRKMADTYFLQENYKLALRLYQDLYPDSPEDLELNYRIGICYLHTISKSNSIFYLEKAKKLDVKSKYHDIEHFLGIAFQSKQDFDKAIEHYELYKKSLNPKLEHDAEALFETNRFMEQCKAGIKLSANPPTNVKIEHLGPKVNSPYSESFPLISADEKTLYFASNRNGSTGGQIDKYTKEYFEDIYYTVKVKDQWSPAKKLKGEINSEFHDVPLSITHDGRKLFISNSDDSNAGDIFSSEFKEDSTWTKPVPIDDDKINSEDWESSACISKDGKILYFSSEREGGFGGSDIYKSQLNNGEWSDPVNLGPTINTPFNEESPFIMDNGKKLCFSSQGHVTMGGFDLFTSNYDYATNKWSEPENLGYPINTAGDEVHISWSEDGKRGYYAVNREENYGDEDIFIIHLGDDWVPTLVPDKKKNKVANITHIPNPPVKETVPTNQDIALAKNDNVTENTTKETPVVKDTVTQNQTTTETGKTKIKKNKNETKVKIESKEETKETKTQEPTIVNNTTNQETKTENTTIKVEEKPIEVPPALAIHHTKTVNRPSVGQIINEKVHWGYNGSSYITEYSRHKLESVEELLRKYPDLKLEIDGYTDDMGSVEYNLLISLKRAKTVYNYLTSQGIDASRLTVKGFGATNMVVKTPGVSEAVKNRRVEFKVLE